MKPVNSAADRVNTETADSTDRAEGTSAAAASILDRVKGVEVSILERLLTIRQEQKRLDDYRARAEEKKAEVADAVYQRVRNDYAKRAAALEQRSSPLRTQARHEYRKLRSLFEEVGRAHELAQLQKDEFEFRRAVGELDDDQLAERLKDPQRVLDQCRADQAALDEYKARFVEALGSEDMLDATAQVASSDPAGDAGEPSSDRTILASDVLSQLSANDTARAAGGAGPPEDDHTIMMPSAALVPGDPTASSQEYALAPLNGIGRSDENHIHITSPGISRKHAVIRAVPGGFTIKDLDSQNGTFVNGERIAERRLADGDTIAVGNVTFIFRMPWPASGGSSKRSS